MSKRNYELMLVLSPELEETALDTLLDRIKLFLENAQADVTSFKSWGLRRLAYTIQGYREGRYYLVHFTGDSENCSELERNLILTENILRHLLTRAVSVSADEPESVDEVDVSDAESESDTDEDEEISDTE